MRLSGVEIHTLWPAGIGSPSVGGGGAPFALAAVVALARFAAGCGVDRKYDWLSWCHTVCATPDVYVPGCLRTASIPALRRIE